MEPIILQATEEHWADCYDILLDSPLAAVYFARQNPRGMLLRALKTGEIFVMLTGSNTCIGFVWVELNGTLGKYPYLHIVVVERAFRGRGLGRKLVAYAEDIICKDYDKLFLLVGDFNVRARDFYSKLGYENLGVLPDFYVDGVDELLLMIRLNSGG